MISPDKIEEWIKEVEERPASAPVILRLIANRLRELADRNEELLEENIALSTGERVEQYENRIAHLEYQLELLKRQFGGELPAFEATLTGVDPEVTTTQSMLSLLIYDVNGHVHNLELDPSHLADMATVGH